MMYTIDHVLGLTPKLEEKIEGLIETRDDDEAKQLAYEIEQIYKENMCFSNTYSEVRAALTATDIKGFCTIERGYLNATTMYK